MKIIIYILLILAIAGIVAADGITPYKLVEIKFEGNDKISDTELSEIIISRESPGWISSLINTLTGFGDDEIYFDSSYIATDINSMQQYYYSKGYFQAKFKSSYELDDEDEEAVLIYTIKENEPSYFRSLKFNGLENIAWETAKEVEELQGVDTSKIYSAEEVAERRDRVLRLGLDFGHMLIKADEPIVTVDTVINKVDVVVNFNIGERYTISEVRIDESGPGAKHVDKELIHSISGVDSGKYYSYYDLQRAQVRLYRTNMFTSVVANGVVSDTSGDRVPVNISTDVGLMHELTPEIILNNEDDVLNLGLGLSFSKMNFLGGARRITISTSTASQSLPEFVAHPSITDTTIYGYADARVILDQPYLYGKNISSTFENYYTLQKRRDEYNATLYGSKISFDVEMSKYVFFTSLVVGLSLEKSKYIFSRSYMTDALYTALENQNTSLPDSVIQDSVDALANQIGDFTSEATNSVISIDVGANKTDDILFPTRGYSMFLTFEDGNSLPALIGTLNGNGISEPRYYKVIFNGTVFFPFYKSDENAFGMKFKTGYIQAYKGNKFEIPLNQKFYAGGSNSNRGWSSRDLVPEQNRLELSDNPTPEEIDAVLVRNIIPGGFFIMEGSMETRNRIMGQFGGALFVDYGNVWNHYRDVQWNNIAVGAGFGLRYYSDFAPFRIDFGFKVYDPDDRRSFFKKSVWQETLEFHFGIGEAF